MAKQENGIPVSPKTANAGPPLAPRRRTAPKPPAKGATAVKPAAAVERAAAVKPDTTPKPPRRPRKAKASPPPVDPPAAPRPPALSGLSEEEQVLSAKYLPRDLPPRVFEEERFIFPESYGVNRVRLLVKDPHWLFAHWDVDPRVREELRREKGERVAALARLTLRLTDSSGAGGAVVLPEGARSWYLRAVPGHRSYRVELGLTLPSGEYRPLSQSNTVSTPRLGPSPEKATRRATYRLAAKHPPSVSSAAYTAGSGSASGVSTAPASAQGGAAGAAVPASTEAERGSASEPAPGAEPGGASDLYRR
jgi:hypothetical protein